MQAQYPLSSHAPDDILAYRHGQGVAAGRFFQDALSLASTLVPGGHVINVCHDRYLFAVGLAALGSGVVNSLLHLRFSAAMLADCGAGAVILGHSERRADHGETSEIVCAKAAAAQAEGLLPLPRPACAVLNPAGSFTSTTAGCP